MNVQCARCQTAYTLDDALVPGAGALVQCSRCQHTFTVVRPGGNPPAGTGVPLPRRDVMWFGSPAQVPNARPLSAVPAPVKRPRPAAPLTDEGDVLWDRVGEAFDDVDTLRVLSDALQERGDPRGRLLAMQLDEELGRDLMRKVKINVLLRDFGPQWAPPGARVLEYRRGIPHSLVWEQAVTDPEHPAWRLVRELDCALTSVPTPSVFDVERPRLRAVTGLSFPMLRHLLDAAPPAIERLDAQAPAGELVGFFIDRLARLPRLRELTLRTTRGRIDTTLSGWQLSLLVQRMAQARRLRFSLPAIPLAELDALCAAAPALEVQGLVMLTPSTGGPIELVFDIASRTLRVPRFLGLNALTDFVARELSQTLRHPVRLVVAPGSAP